MRELKFRAWHNGNESFVYATIKGAWMNGVECVRAGAYPATPAAQEMMESEIDSQTFVPNADWEQFTGLLDVNGVEIYEGDILSTSNADPAYDTWSKEENGYTIVQWSDEWSGFRGSNWDWDVSSEQESIYSISLFIEVIGNIHEHGGLLK